MKIKILFLICLLTNAMIQLFGQDPYFSQFQNVPIYYNPAYTGLYTGIRARFAFRDQWPALPYDFKSYHFSADIGERNLPGSGGVGLLINTDNEGIGFIKNFNLGLAVAVRIPLSKNAIGQLGFKAAWLQKRINWDDFVFSDALDERYGNIYATGFQRPDRNVLNLPDFGVGGIVQFADETGSFSGTVGFAADHLFEPDQSFLQTAKAPLPRKYVAHIDGIYAIGSSSGFNTVSDDALKLNPGIMFQSQGGLNAIQAGMNLTKYGVYLGLWYKGAFGTYANTSLAMLVGYRYVFADNIGIKFTYSYDMQLSGALMGTGGAHEVTLVIDFNTGGFLGSSGGGSTSRGIKRGGYDSRLECSEF
ncbi:MAG: PorP/SprF family type IX secretion system membrane protein [Bacteroidetes bacterium]|nr:PorP/SprF family type IX secretion system membrane protein [Bacteroidota bacterium]